LNLRRGDHALAEIVNKIERVFGAALARQIANNGAARYAGKLTNELIYSQLPPGIRQELERLNPKAEKGRRKYHHHRFLTGQIGHPHLEKQVAVVTALMRISPDWPAFMQHFNANFRSHIPRQMDLFTEIEAKEKTEAAYFASVQSTCCSCIS
jgi:hypothetical protein